MSAVFHGGRLDEAVARFGGLREKWLDLSTGINPHSWPIGEIDPNVWRRLPDQGLEAAAVDAARSYYQSLPGCPCALGNGSQSLIQILPFLFKPQNVAIVGFTYQEHGIAWQRAGHEVFVADGIESAVATARIVVAVNPNNPDGRQHRPDQLLELAKKLGPKGGLLVVDEAFGDVAPELSLVGECGREGLFVLRSFGKFFGLSGARLGFGFGPERVVSLLNETLGPWPVSGPALAIGADALVDRRWINRMRRKLKGEREALNAVLTKGGLTILGGTDLFALCSHGSGAALNEHLARKQILIRTFPGREDYLRFGLPATKSGFNRLERALSSFAG